VQPRGTSGEPISKCALIRWTRNTTTESFREELQCSIDKGTGVGDKGEDQNEATRRGLVLHWRSKQKLHQARGSGQVRAGEKVKKHFKEEETEGCRPTHTRSLSASN